jgi:CheY-like chemotaxis protein
MMKLKCVAVAGEMSRRAESGLASSRRPASTDLLLTDVVMPGMIGIVLAKRLRLGLAGYQGAVHVGLLPRQPAS